jgi:hypothetical protein
MVDGQITMSPPVRLYPDPNAAKGGCLHLSPPKPFVTTHPFPTVGHQRSLPSARAQLVA